MVKNNIKVGLIGLGVVGGQVAKVLLERADMLSHQTGSEIELKKIKVLPADLGKPLAQFLPEQLFTTSDEEFFDDNEIDIVIELIGGETPAYDYIKQALGKNKHVVTANKEVIAKHGPELINYAASQGVSLYFEASVGGGIPLIAPLERDLKANYINGIHAIINGTTNYILTRMGDDGLDFDMALKQAQELGYAESNSKNDIEGIDAAYKLAIMATLAFQCQVKPEDVFHEGISSLNARDFKYAKELGYAIKLLAIALQYDNTIEARVHPVFIKQDSFLANVNGVFNAVSIEGDLSGHVIFSGQGAGPLATSSAVTADVLRACRDVQSSTRNRGIILSTQKVIKPVSQIITRYYMRLNINDSSGVLAKIAEVLGQHDISISSVIQKETDDLSKTAEIVIMTHPALGNAIENAIAELKSLEVVKDINTAIRVEEI